MTQPEHRTKTGGQNDELRAVVAKLCPDLDEKGLAAAAVNLQRYFEIASDIITKLERRSDCLTPPGTVSTMKERSNVDLKS